ncbi:MAG: sigma-70 family RNA polymerase sigma factor [Polyangiaceae bacterium]|nr:sigma-70 family RNA polymerase sigma factor [Polyangiaceae bacterium]
MDSLNCAATKDFWQKRPSQSANRVMIKVNGCEFDAVSETQLVEQNLSLVHKLANKHAKRFRRVEKCDLIQVGCVALIEATRTWLRRSRFVTYAYRIIEGEMIDFASHRDTRPPENVYPWDLAVAIGRDVPPEVTTESLSRASESFASLDDIERDVVFLRLMDGVTFSEIARLVDRSVTDVRRIYSRAVFKLARCA